MEELLSSTVIVTILVSAILALLYNLATRNFSYWEKRGVRSVGQWPFLGSLPRVLLLRESLSSALCKKYEQMAGEPFFGMTVLGQPVLVVRDLELVKDILVKNSQFFLDRALSVQEKENPLFSRALMSLKGKKWRHVRMKLTPTFTSGRIRKMFYLVDECGKHLTSCLEKEASKGVITDVKETMARYSTDTIASCAFGIEANSLADPKCEFRSVLKDMAILESFSQQIIAIVASIAPSFGKLFRTGLINDNINHLARRIFWDVVEDRKKNGVFRNDFVDLLMKLKNEMEEKSKTTKSLPEINEGTRVFEEGDSKTDTLATRWEDDDFVAQAFVFLLAGLEGAASTLNYALYEMAMNPDIQKKLRNEIVTVLKKHDTQMTYDAIADMTYLDMVVSETLRKYPGAGFLERQCLSDYKLPGTEVTVEKDTPVMISVAGIHSDPDIYPEPEKFDPERFNDENKVTRSQYAFLGFGLGPRNCLGMRFALMQVKTALARILTTFEVRESAQTPKPPLKFKINSFLLVPKEKIALKFETLV